jgi:probable HAF family extracellular repeat protein
VRASWAVTDLGTLGGRHSEAVAINGSGQVVGAADTKLLHGAAAISHAFLWQDGRMVDLGTLGEGDSRAAAINERGQVVGSSDTKRCQRDHAFLWENGKMRDLGSHQGASHANAVNEQGQILGGDDPIDCSGYSNDWFSTFLWQGGKSVLLDPLFAGNAINDQGQVVGTDYRSGYGGRAVLLQGGKMTDLGGVAGSRDNGAVDINNDAQIVGWAGRRAVLWQNGKLTVLGFLPGKKGSRAIAVNDHGQVIGISYTEPETDFSVGSRPRAFVWQGRTLSDLGRLGGTAFSKPVAVNNSGQIVGVCFSNADQYGYPVDGRAFVWENGTISALPNLSGGKTSSATAINDKGQVVGWSETKTGSQHAVLWTLRSG